MASFAGWLPVSSHFIEIASVRMRCQTVNTRLQRNNPHDPNAHLLLVDDDRLVLTTLCRELQHFGYAVSPAESLQDALDLLKSGLRPDLAILDIRMDDGDGLELAQYLHAFDNLPFIMLSAYSDTATVRKAANIGSLAYMVKPINASQLIPTVESALRRARDIRVLKDQATQLQRVLNTDRAIDVGVGITMAQNRLGRLAALEVLRQSARTQRRKLSNLAHDLIQAIETIRQR